MKARSRNTIASVVALALFVTIAHACFSLPHYGESRGPQLQRQAIEAVRASHATSMDAFINFDLRGFDTLGEEYIFLVAIAGFSLIFREDRGEKSAEVLAPTAPRKPREGEVEVELATSVYVPIAVAYGAYIIIHGQLTPGGGFQGGVALATGLLAIGLGFGYAAFRRFAPKQPVEAIESLGALAYVVVGIAMLVTSGVFLRNALPHGDTGALLSGGTIVVLNDAVGIAIVGGFMVLFAEYFEELATDS